jgi:PDDEXK-like domain of unknown function (DUF3799)
MSDYNHNSDRLSYSKLSCLANDPQDFYDFHVARTAVYKPKKSQQLGTLAHAMLLEPSQLAKFAVMPAGMRRGTKAYDAFMADHAGRTEVSEREHNDACDAVRFVTGHPIAGKYFFGERDYEKPVYGELFGLPFQCKPDVIHYGLGSVVDVKTCSDLSDRAIRYAIRDWKYDLQAGIYTQLVGISEWRWIFVKAGDRPKCRVIKASEQTIAGGLAFAWRLCEEYKARMQSGDWVGAWEKEETEIDFIRSDEDETPVEVSIEVDLGDAEF